MAGVEADISPRLTFSAEYRYWFTSDFDLRHPDGAPAGTDQRTTSVLVGLRFSLSRGD